MADEMSSERISLSGLTRKRKIVNSATRYVVGLGGAAVIAAIALIFFYLVYVVAPIFAPISVTELDGTAIDGKPLMVEANDSFELLAIVFPSGSVSFMDTEDWEVVRTVDLGTGPLRQVVPVYPLTNTYAALNAKDEILLFRSTHRVRFDGDVRRLEAGVETLHEGVPITLDSTPIAYDTYRVDESLRVAWVSAEGTIGVREYTDVEDDFELEFPEQTLLQRESAPRHLFFGPRGQWLYEIDDDGGYRVTNIQYLDDVGESKTGRLVPIGTPLTAVAPLLGRYSILGADANGLVTQWFLQRDEFGTDLTMARHFQFPDPIVRIVTEPRRKGFIAVDSTNQGHLTYTTSGAILKSFDVGMQPRLASVAPRSDRLIAVDDSRIGVFAIDNPHPEISWTTLWQKIWYEGYEAPVYSWQSSSAETDFEPKFSLMPLLFGTLKAAFYAMLFAMPLAIMGAIYTAYFMSPRMRRWVKPGIEIMAALPTVILGFLAGLWLAPVIEDQLTAVILCIFVLPIGMLTFAMLWDKLPRRYTASFQGWLAALSVPVLVGLGVLLFQFDDQLELFIFQGSAQTWFQEELGLSYDQRNATVVGIAMGLAVIPTIFSISEDAIHGVPHHLTQGSLALGATPWQTLTRVVILTASPGIFSAVMIGLGRAVGETMIVLMATGNTAVMDMNLFQGMRTFAANIAVELPEAELDSSHYRILFLTALVLFIITFFFNTIAEIVRQRLRARYGNL